MPPLPAGSGRETRGMTKKKKVFVSYSTNKSQANRPNRANEQPTWKMMTPHDDYKIRVDNPNPEQAYTTLSGSVTIA